MGGAGGDVPGVVVRGGGGGFAHPQPVTVVGVGGDVGGGRSGRGGLGRQGVDGQCLDGQQPFGADLGVCARPLAGVAAREWRFVLAGCRVAGRWLVAWVLVVTCLVVTCLVVTCWLVDVGEGEEVRGGGCAGAAGIDDVDVAFARRLAGETAVRVVSLTMVKLVAGMLPK